MVAPVDNFIQLPTDAANTGKKRRTIQKVIGANTVEEDVVVIGSKRNILGRYMHTYTSFSTSNTKPHYAISNPVGSGVNLAIKRAEMEAVITGLTTAETSAPQMEIWKASNTGVPTRQVGAALPNIKKDSAMPNAAQLHVAYASGSLVTTFDGLTLVYGDYYWIGLLSLHPTATSTNEVQHAAKNKYEALSEEDEIILRPGESAVVRFSIPSTASHLVAFRCEVDEVEM